MRDSRLFLIAPLAFALAACAPSGESGHESDSDAALAADVAGSLPPAESTPTEPAKPAGAVANVALKPTQGNQTHGELRMAMVDGEVQVSGRIEGLPGDSEHGFHVHETGDCSAPDGTSAGGHFNPEHVAHGRAGHGEAHAGDSDNIRADGDGVAMIDAVIPGATLGDGGPNDIMGLAVIVHADPDDYVSQPTGNAGDRVACGLIEP